VSWFQASQQWPTMWWKDLKIRFESQFSGMNCHTFSCGLSSGRSAQGDQRDVGRGDQFGRETPARLIDEKSGVGAWNDLGSDFGEIEVHRLCVASRHDERRALAVLGTDRAEDIGRGGSLVFRGARARPVLGPAERDLVLPSNARLVGKPDFYDSGLDALFMPDLRQALRETFLNLRPRRRPERDGEDEPKVCDSPWRPRRGIPRKSIGRDQ
jgi:hypothetical protein